MISFRSKITQTVLSYFLLHDEAEMYVNEMARKFDLDSGNLARKLLELEKEGILKIREIGDQRHYSLNKGFPLYREYKNIVMKTVGLEHALAKALSDVPGIQRAFIYGSYAADKMDQFSDIDVLAVGNHKTIELQKKLAGVQKSVDREINCISMTPEEYAKKRNKDDFLKKVSRKAKIDLIK